MPLFPPAEGENVTVVLNFQLPANIPLEYTELVEVFSKQRATSLPPHWSYDCAINLHPGTVHTTRLVSDPRPAC